MNQEIKSVKIEELEPGLFREALVKIYNYLESRGISNLTLIEKASIKCYIKEKGQEYWQNTVDSPSNMISFLQDWAKTEYDYNFKTRTDEFIIKGATLKESFNMAVFELNHLREISHNP